MAMVVGSAMTAVATVATQVSAKVEAEQVTATVAVGRKRTISLERV